METLHRLSVHIKPIASLMHYYPEPRGDSMLPLYFQVSFKIKNRRIYRSEDGTNWVTGGFDSTPPGVDVWSDTRSFFQFEEAAHLVLSPTMSGFGMVPRHYTPMISGISQSVRQFVVRTHEKAAYLPLRVEIAWEQQEYYDDRFVVEQSRMEFEINNNHGMVPTARKSLRLKCVKVNKDQTEKCSVCWDEFEEFAAAMPCKHLFHALCIGKWLETSHYCPNCRYEMPTQTSV